MRCARASTRRSDSFLAYVSLVSHRDVQCYDAEFTVQLTRLRIRAAVSKFPERQSNNITSSGRDHGFSDTDDESDEEADEMDTNQFKLRNAVACAAGGGRPRALTRANARFAAPYAAMLLQERGYVVVRGDAEQVLEWLESEPFALPSEELWRRMMFVS